MNTENQNPPCQCAGVWVKASEGKPKEGTEDLTVKVRGKKSMLLSSFDSNKFHFYGSTDYYDEYSFGFIEWLDETRCACKERQFIKGCISVKPEQMEDFRETVLERQQEWVRVDSGVLPEVGEWVLLCFESETILKGRRLHDGWSALFSDGEKSIGDRELTHWSPLPDLPQQ